MEQSPRLSLSYLAPSQAQKHVTVNETFRRLDQLVQQTILSRATGAQPGAPSDGDAYIITGSATGAEWGAYTEGNIAAYQDGAWTEIDKFEGMRAWDAGADEFIVCDGSAWSALSGGGGSETAAKFGINTTADTTNRLAVKSDAVLFNHDDVTPGSGDCQVKINKDETGDTASLLFQSGASGRAEFGLTGDDDFHLKVSADGSAWTEALTIDNSNGNTGIGETAPLGKLHVKVSDTGGAPNGFADGLVVEENGTTGITIISGVTHSVAFFFGDTDSATRGRLVYDNSVDTLQIYANGGKRMDIFSGVIIGSPTGGDKGVGTLNAVGVYDDNSLLSCYVFDQALDGAVDAAKWDAKVPDRIIKGDFDPDTGKTPDDQRIVRTHAPMRKFAARSGTDYDPLTLDGYARHWKEKRHLTSMPNEAAFDPEAGMTTGEWIQRLVETVEIQAVLIEQLNTRMTALSSRDKG